MLSDKSISSNVFAINENLNLNKKDKFLIFSPPNYAMGISQILSAMYAKGEIFFYNKGLKFPNELLEIILKYKISILNLSISAFRILENYIKKKKFFSVRIVMSGGTTLTGEKRDTIEIDPMMKMRKPISGKR